MQGSPAQVPFTHRSLCAPASVRAGWGQLPAPSPENGPLANKNHGSHKATSHSQQTVYTQTQKLTPLVLRGIGCIVVLGVFRAAWRDELEVSLWESSSLVRLIRSPGPSRRKGSRALEKEKGVQGSQGGEKDKSFFLHCFILVNLRVYLAWE